MQLSGLSVVLALLAADCIAQAPPAATVVLLHGLARSASSMDDMARSLEQAGYRVCNIDYPSREHEIAELAAKFVAPEIARCVADPAQPLNFVTHSMGGIVVRELARTGAVQPIGRVVMLGPPNHGSEVVDRLGGWSIFGAINGPAGGQLGTAEDSVPQSLGPAGFEVGVIAGNHTINWINSLMIPGPDDGKVSVESAKLEGMRDFVIVPESHPFLMMDPQVIGLTIGFLQSGCFAPATGICAAAPEGE
ncbi:MAG TPA: alpha/beta fold hydrolase [Fontimonas sp.]